MTRWAPAPQQREQLVLFAEKLDDALPQNHTVRLLDTILGGLSWSKWEAVYHGRLGQPPIHPRVLAGVLLYGLLTRLRSSRSLEEALQVRLDFRWLAEGRSLDHTTLSEFRRKHANELKDLFVQVCQVARELGLLTLQRLGFDGTRVRSNNRPRGTRTPAELKAEKAELEAKYQEFAAQAEAEDARDEEVFGLQAPQELPPQLADDARRQAEVKKALARVEELDRALAAGETLPKRLPITDPQSRIMPNKEGGYAPNYTPTATVDIGSGLIVGADVLGVNNEDSFLPAAVDQVQQDYGLAAPPAEVLADGLMCTGANVAAMEDRGVTLYSPCKIPNPQTNPALRADPTQPVPQADWERLPRHKIKGQSGEQLDKSAFVYDAKRDCYWCPLGQPLRYTSTTRERSATGQRIRDRYQAAPAACAGCPLRASCVQRKAKARQINREQFEGRRERHAQRMATAEAQQIYALRRHAGERPFAVIKHQFGLRRFLLRGLARVRMEWRWAALAFNLQRLMSLLRSRPGPERSPIVVHP